MNPSSVKPTLWQFTDDLGSFKVESPDRVSRLYFPLANEAGILSSITPDLHGDVKTSHNSYLMQPVSIESLHNSKMSRNFWVYIEGKGAWSLTGVSAAQNAQKILSEHEDGSEQVRLEAGILWHKITRENRSIGLKSEITNFAPASQDPVEIMIVKLTNTSGAKIHITPTSAIPIFARSADNLRDHHHVTSLLHRILSHNAGVIVKPTMSFDERGHKVNDLLYCVLGFGENGEAPVGSFSTVQDFIGEGGNLEAPRAILQNLPPPQKDITSFQGKSAIGALRFKTTTLGAHQSVSFVLILGIGSHQSQIEQWIKKYGDPSKAETALRENKTFWSKKVSSVRFITHDKNYDGWVRWVCLQPTLRKIFGCSFLPDFDYGRGGRGWRDLWQDCLALLLTSPADAKPLLLNNFNGIRIDGSNATIIGSGSGEFIADRNNITRVWMDHGVWPYLTLSLYIHQTGDMGILFQNASYFRDRQLARATRKDPAWNESDGQTLKTKAGAAAEGSILEHLLVQHLVQFFNVGEHNHIRLENADWNDGLDMAYERGESVAFTCLYGSNLKGLAELLRETAKHTGLKKISVCRELLLLLDRVGTNQVDYNSPQKKRARLEKYFDAVQPVLSGKKAEIAVEALARDLEEKSAFITAHVRQKEWIQTPAGEGLFNGYYDNHGRRVEGNFPQGLRLTLAGQVFPIMSQIASNEQIQEIFSTAKKHLKDRTYGGFRLNTDFHEIRLDLGRAFSFAYGEKENGAFFNHMVVMFAYALLSRGFVKEGHEVLGSIYRMCVDTDKSKIYPGIPEYFNSEGRGMYYYLTGSASWFLMTLLTQVFGVRGFYGNFLLAPKLTQNNFMNRTEISVETFFAGKPVTITYRNPKKVGYEHYYVSKVLVNRKELKGIELNKKEVLISRALLLKHLKNSANDITVILE